MSVTAPSPPEREVLAASAGERTPELPPVLELLIASRPERERRAVALAVAGALAAHLLLILLFIVLGPLGGKWRGVLPVTSESEDHPIAILLPNSLGGAAPRAPAAPAPGRGEQRLITPTRIPREIPPLPAQGAGQRQQEGQGGQGAAAANAGAQPAGGGGYNAAEALKPHSWDRRLWEPPEALLPRESDADRVAARVGGGDLTGNPRLRTAVLAAKAVNMPADNIDRAIKKGTGELEGVTYEEITYEGYGPGGAAILIEVTTDNPNRTVADIRHIFDKHAGKLAATGAVAFQFDKRGQVYLDTARYEEDAAMEAALDAGATDFVREGDQYIVTTAVADLHTVQEGLKSRGIVPESIEIAMIPRSTVKVEGKNAETLVKLMEALEEHDDVSRVSSNFDVDLEALAGV